MFEHFSAREAVQSLLAIIVVAVLGYLYIQEIDVPKELISLTSLVLGFYFKQSVNGITKRINK